MDTSRQPDEPRRPRLSPAIADVRRAVREFLETAALPPDSLVLVALSGGPDSLALAAATAFEAPRAGLRAGAVIVDHGLQPGSADVAVAAADQARSLGLGFALVKAVTVGVEGGPEAAARVARYAALEAAASETGAAIVLLGHTLDDQAETVLLGLARGSGATSLHGMGASTSSATGASSSATKATASATGATASATGASSSATGATASATRTTFGRPLLGIRRATTHQFCEDSGLTPWHDPQNDDPSFARVRVRNTVLPMLERELGPGIAEALARTADQLREDSDALDHFAEEMAEDIADLAESGISLSVRSLASNPPALRQRLIRLAVEGEFHVSLSRVHTLEVARLVTHWHGQKPLDLPGIRVERRGGLLIFTSA